MTWPLDVSPGCNKIAVSKQRREPGRQPDRISAMPCARILIVEDEFLVASNLEAILEDLGHESVGIAPDMQTAMELAVQAPDLALVDVNLRDGETGPTIAERLRRDHGVAVLFVTANPRMVERAWPAALGVLSKPCDDALIGACVDYALSTRLGIPLPAPPGLTLLREQAA